VTSQNGRMCLFVFFSFWFVCVAVCSVLSLYHLPSLWYPALHLGKASVSNQHPAFSCLLALLLLWCLHSSLTTRMENGADERRQMTTSRPFSSSRPALPTVAFSTSRDGLCFCTSDLALSFDVSIPTPSILYSLPPGFRFISPAQTLYLLYILTLPILFPSDRVLRRLSFFSFPRAWKGDELAVLWSRLAVEFCFAWYFIFDIFLFLWDLLFFLFGFLRPCYLSMDRNTFNIGVSFAI
jgi:hypothetical protein